MKKVVGSLRERYPQEFSEELVNLSTAPLLDSSEKDELYDQAVRIVLGEQRGSASLLFITATDRVGLLYSITRVLAQHGINVQTARINLGYTQIKAPIPGRIGKSAVTDGAIVTAYQPMALATIQRLDPIYVDVPQSTTELLRLQRRLEGKELNRDGANVNLVQLSLPEIIASKAPRTPSMETIMMSSPGLSPASSIAWMAPRAMSSL